MRTGPITPIFLMLLLCSNSSVVSQSTAFNFQGRLNDGTSPANGQYDLQLKLYDAITGGTQVGATLSRPNLTLINGVFSTPLNFGSSAFDSGNRFLEISVRPFNSPNAFVVLGARQQILSVPFAVRSTSAANADNATNSQNAVNAQTAINATNSTNATNAVNAQNATSAQNATTAQNSLSLGGFSSSEYARLNFINSGDLRTNGGLAINGNAVQSATSYGLPKALIFMNGNIGGPSVQRCFNSQTGSTTGTCGFNIIAALPLRGVYRIDFGFDVTNRFVAVTPVYNSGNNVEGGNYSANFRYFNPTTLEIFTFQSGNSADTADCAFSVMVF